MIDIVDVTMPFTAADFADRAKEVINDIISRGKIPILAGGTGLYFRILLQDFDLPRVAPDNDLREELNQKSAEELYEMLQKLDCESAKKIHFNNKVKIIRALEVSIKLGIPMSKAQKEKKSQYDTLWFALNSQDRQYLYSRINSRVDIMMEKGLLDEFKYLYSKYGQNHILLNTIGYQEFFPYIKGDCDLDTSVNSLKQNTRRYAKRQISWFNSNDEIHWFDIKNTNENEILNQCVCMYKEM